LQFKHLRRLLGGFIGSKLKRNHYRKTQRTAGRKSSRNKTQTGEEGRRVFSKPFEENSTEEDPIPDRQFCIHSILTVAIQDKFEVSLTLPSIGRLLSSLDITPQKPLRRAYERDEKQIRQWKEEKYPALRKRAKQRGADIFFLDEVGVRSDSPLGRSYGLKGKTPVVKTSGQRQKINAISAVNAKGAFWYKVYGGTLTAALFLVMLKDLMKGRKKPVMLVVDGLPVHKAKSVAKYVQSTKGRLELHFLPPYAPDLNPDEFAWSHLKQNGTSKKPLRKNEALRQRVEEDLKGIQEDRRLVRSFFSAPSVSYAIY
jgi:transposase